MQECYSPSTNTLGNDYFNRNIGSSSHTGISPGGGGVKIGGRRRAGSGQQTKSTTNTTMDSEDGSDLDNR